jgi:hypothetical protein
MLPNARRINFYENFYRPEEIVFVKSKPKSLLNDKGQFIIHLDEKTPYVEELVKKAQKLNLTVSGDGTSPVTGGDIRQARNGDFLSVGTSTRFDLNWIKRGGYVCENGFRPVYTMSKDWKKINEALEHYADLKNGRFNNTCPLCGSKVNYHSRFSVVDGRVRLYNADELAVVIPKKIELPEFDYRIINIRFQY